MKKKLLLCMMIFLMVMVQLQSGLVYARGTETVQTVRVGFFAFDGYHMIDEEGRKSGYGYEFLNLLSRYCNLRFEYIGYDKSWEETLKMLETGEIDLVTSAKKTSEREKKFAFSRPIGSSYTIITVHKDNDRIISGDYQTYDGMRMGLLRGSSQNDNLKDFAKEKEFSYKPVYYDSVDQLKDALKRGKIDAITTSSLREIEEERVIEKFDANLFYAIVRKEDTSLLDEINYGIEQMDLTEGDWKNQLSYRFYDMEDNVLRFTDREKELIQFYASDEHRLKVACNVDRDPYSYVENGEIKGVIPDIFSYLMKMAGIPFTYSIPESREQYEEWMRSGTADIFIDYDSKNGNMVAEAGGVVTADYLEMHIARLFRLDQGDIGRRIALAKNQKLDEDSLFTKDAELIYFENREAAMDAVLDGRADVTYVYSYMAQKFINGHRNGNLSYTALEEPSYAYCCYLPDRVNHELAGILTKCIYHMPSDELQRIISENTRYRVENMTLAEYLELYPYIILGILAAFVALTMIIVLFMKVQTKQRLLIQEKENLVQMEQMARKAQAAERSKTNFLFNMSHDIRTPMNAIIGFTDLLEKHLDDKECARTYIKNIQTSNDFLLSIINNVLEMARIESGKTTLDESCCNVYEFNDSLFSMFDPQMREKGIRFTRMCRIEHTDVICDETKLREVFLNILSNSLKYTPAGGTVTMKLTELPSDRPGYAMFQTVIEDTGIGMSEEFISHLFEEFTRERSSTESKLNGTGLGMPIVKKLVDLMQGNIEVESKVGKGTRITVTLPHRIDGAEDIIHQTEKASDYDMVSFKGKRILLAEDNELNAEIAITVLEEAGFEVELAEDGLICVDILEKADAGYYDLILMDIQMPNMDGYKATRTIRKLADKEKAGIPIVAMTANAFEEDKQDAYDAGMNRHIAKPIRVEELMAALAEILKEEK